MVSAVFHRLTGGLESSLGQPISAKRVLRISALAGTTLLAALLYQKAGNGFLFAGLGVAGVSHLTLSSLVQHQASGEVVGPALLCSRIALGSLIAGSTLSYGLWRTMLLVAHVIGRHYRRAVGDIFYLSAAVGYGLEAGKALLDGALQLWEDSDNGYSRLDRRLRRVGETTFQRMHSWKGQILSWGWLHAPDQVTSLIKGLAEFDKPLPEGSVSLMLRGMGTAQRRCHLRSLLGQLRLGLAQGSLAPPETEALLAHVGELLAGSTDQELLEPVRFLIPLLQQLKARQGTSYRFPPLIMEHIRRCLHSYGSHGLHPWSWYLRREPVRTAQDLALAVKYITEHDPNCGTHEWQADLKQLRDELSQFRSLTPASTQLPLTGVLASPPYGLKTRDFDRIHRSLGQPETIDGGLARMGLVDPSDLTELELISPQTLTLQRTARRRAVTRTLLRHIREMKAEGVRAKNMRSRDHVYQLLSLADPSSFPQRGWRITGLGISYRVTKALMVIYSLVIQPSTSLMGVGLGASYELLQRLGVKVDFLADLIVAHSKSRFWTSILERRRLFTHTPRTELGERLFLNSNYAGKARLINWDSLLTILAAHVELRGLSDFKPGALIQGVLVGRELVELGSSSLQKLYNAFNCR